MAVDLRIQIVERRQFNGWGLDREEPMFFEAILKFSTELFGSPKLGLELFAASILGLLVMFYLVRVAWIALSDVRRMEMKAVHAETPSNSHYSGSSTAG